MDVEHLKKYKDNCYSALSRDLTEFEKNFLLVAGGLLAFSITFIKDIIKISDAQFLILLFLGWAFIITAIGIMMHAFLKSANASDQLWKITDDFIGANCLYDDKTELSDEQCQEIRGQINAILETNKQSLKKLRIVAVNVFLVGLVLFSIFIGINLIRENNAETKKAETNFIKKVFINDTIILQNKKQ